MSSRERRSVIATRSPSSYSGYSRAERIAGGDPLLADPIQHLRPRARRGAPRTPAPPAPRAAARHRRPRPAARARRPCGGPAARRARRSRGGRARRGRSCPASAFSACEVQMLWVAFSRRMCCSRVCSASTKPRRPSASVVSPAIRPGIRRRCSSVAAKNPNEGPPKSSRLPSGWPSPTATSTPHSPGGRRTPSVIASTEATQSAPDVVGGRGERLEVLDRAEEVRVLDEDGGDVRRRAPRRARRRR